MSHSVFLKAQTWHKEISDYGALLRAERLQRSQHPGGRMPRNFSYTELRGELKKHN